MAQCYWCCYCYYTFILCWSTWTHRSVVLGTTGQPPAVMGQYSVSNGLQCSRLCVYRKLCTHFTFEDQPFRSGTDAVGHCLLFASNPGTANSEPVRIQEIANACAKRPCGVTELCYPITPGTDQHVCLPHAAQCQDPPAIGNASIFSTGSSQGHVATVTCLPDFVLSPSNASPNQTCLVTSEWSAFNGECRQAKSSGNITVPFLKPLPYPITSGWSACFKGVFLGNGAVYFNFLPELPVAYSERQRNIDEINQNIILRAVCSDVPLSTGEPRNQTFSWANRTNGTFAQFDRKEGMPLRAKDSFTVRFSLSGNLMTISINNVFSSSLDLSAHLVNISAVVHLAVFQNVSLTYAHLVSGDACLPSST